MMNENLYDPMISIIISIAIEISNDIFALRVIGYVVHSEQKSKNVCTGRRFYTRKIDGRN